MSASYLDLELEIDSEGRLRTTLFEKRDDFNFVIVYFPFIWSNISTAPAYGIYISQLIRYSRTCGCYKDSLDWGLLLTRKLRTKRSCWLSWSHYFESCMVGTMTWLTLWNICVTNDHEMFHLQTFPGPFLIHDLARRVPIVQQAMLTLLEHLTSPPVFNGVRVPWSLVLYVCFVDRCLSICTFSFGHCVVCSSIYGFWLPLWYLQTRLQV